MAEIEQKIEVTYPEINVDELMNKIRSEVARNSNSSSITPSQPGDRTASVMASLNWIEALLKNADFKSQVRTEFPKKLDRFPWNISKPLQRLALRVYAFLLKEQRAVNFSVIQALRESMVLNRQLFQQVATLEAQVKEISDRLTATDERLSAVLTATNERLGATDERLTAALSATNERLTAALSATNERLTAALSATNERLSATNEHLTTALSATNEHLTATSEHLTATNERLTATDERLTTTLTAVNEHLSAALTATNEHLNAALTATNEQLKAVDERHIRNDSYLKNDLSQQKRLIAMFLEEARQRLPEPFSQEQLQTFVDESDRSADAFYVAFEDQFRGSREDIFNRLKVYLPLIEQAKVGTPESPILDIGCGRGEWLDLLGESGYTAKGVDINRVMLEQCHTRGLDVIESDAIAYLQSLPDASLGVVTGFHIIEHLPFNVLIKLFDETVRVLKPGGLVIYETPNPENVLVGSHTFYLDPTHCKPLPSSLVHFLAESRGLCQAKIMNLHPYPDRFRVSGSDLAERFNDYFYSAQDYSIVGYKE